jgi:hypothetical protein
MNIFLATILDSFKAKNPKLWGIIAFLLLIVQFVLIKGSEFGWFEIDGIVKDALQTITMLVGLLLGSRTSQILADDAPKPLELPSPIVHEPIEIKEYSDIQFVAPHEDNPIPKKHRGRPRKI